MRFLQADYLFPIYMPPIKNGILQINFDGKVVDIHKENSLSGVPIEKFSGVLCPGFINSHCHLELSHLLNCISPNSGLVKFIKEISNRPKVSKSIIKNKIIAAENQMIANGIVGVGDICNTDDTLFLKRENNISYYNFIETFQIDEQKFENTINNSIEIRNRFSSYGLKATIVPHSPYSVPPDLMKMIYEQIDDKSDVISIHNQESKEENMLFHSKDGELIRWLLSISASNKIWKKIHKSTDVLHNIFNQKHLLVHNTFMSKDDVIDAYYCTCPKANIYIEGVTPDYSFFNVNKLCVGTDSLASNSNLSIIEELFCVQENSDFDLNTLLKIGSQNGADCLGFTDLGTFEKGKIPGVNLLRNIDIKMKITSETTVRKII